MVTSSVLSFFLLKFLMLLKGLEGKQQKHPQTTVQRAGAAGRGRGAAPGAPHLVGSPRRDRGHPLRAPGQSLVKRKTGPFRGPPPSPGGSEDRRGRALAEAGVRPARRWARRAGAALRRAACAPGGGAATPPRARAPPPAPAAAGGAGHTREPALTAAAWGRSGRPPGHRSGPPGRAARRSEPGSRCARGRARGRPSWGGAGWGPRGLRAERAPGAPGAVDRRRPGWQVPSRPRVAPGGDVRAAGGWAAGDARGAELRSDPRREPARPRLSRVGGRAGLREARGAARARGPREGELVGAAARGAPSTPPARDPRAGASRGRGEPGSVSAPRLTLWSRWRLSLGRTSGAGGAGGALSHRVAVSRGRRGAGRGARWPPAGSSGGGETRALPPALRSERVAGRCGASSVPGSTPALLWWPGKVDRRGWEAAEISSPCVQGAEDGCVSVVLSASVLERRSLR